MAFRDSDIIKAEGRGSVKFRPANHTPLIGESDGWRAGPRALDRSDLECLRGFLHRFRGRRESDGNEAGECLMPNCQRTSTLGYKQGDNVSLNKLVFMMCVLWLIYPRFITSAEDVMLLLASVYLYVCLIAATRQRFSSNCLEPGRTVRGRAR